MGVQCHFAADAVKDGSWGSVFLEYVREEVSYRAAADQLTLRHKSFGLLIKTVVLPLRSHLEFVLSIKSPKTCTCVTMLHVTDVVK